MQMRLLTKLLHDFSTPLTSLLNIVDVLEIHDMQKQFLALLKSSSQQMRLIIELWRKLIANVDDEITIINCESYCMELINSLKKEKKILIKFDKNINISIQSADFIFKFLFILSDLLKYDANIDITFINDFFHFQFKKRENFTIDLLKQNEFFDELIDIKAFEKKFKINVRSDENFYYLNLKEN